MVIIFLLGAIVVANPILDMTDSLRHGVAESMGVVGAFLRRLSSSVDESKNASHVVASLDLWGWDGGLGAGTRGKVCLGWC